MEKTVRSLPKWETPLDVDYSRRDMTATREPTTAIPIEFTRYEFEFTSYMITAQTGSSYWAQILVGYVVDLIPQKTSHNRAILPQLLETEIHRSERRFPILM